MKKDILTLGIESSCDETSASIVKNGREILSNIIDTQIPIHEKYGGVVPEIASRNHIEAISRVVKLALKEANVKVNRNLMWSVYKIMRGQKRLERFEEDGQDIELLKLQNSFIDDETIELLKEMRTEYYEE